MIKIKLSMIILCMLLIAKSSFADPVIVNEKNNTVKTARALYSIKADPSSGSQFSRCVSKDDDWLMCSPQDIMIWGKPIHLKDYNILPLYSSCSGSACTFSNTTLLIEAEDSLYFDMGLISYDLSAGKVAKTDYDNNEVDFILNREGGAKQFAAKFINGKVVVLNAGLDSGEKIGSEECEWLYKEFLDGCLEEKKYSTCLNVMNSMAMVFQRGVYGLINNYRSFPKQKLEKTCDSVCATGDKPEIRSFKKQICRW